MFVRALMALSVLGLSALLATAKESEPLEVVPSVDFNGYTGLWYEIARLPNRFEKACASDVTASYTLLEGGEIKVVNQCRKESGELKSAEGRARQVDKNGPPSKLKVRFAPGFLSFLPFVWGDYWIIDLAPDYSYAVVGEPGRDYLWILSRSAQMDDAVYRQAVERAAAKGFDTGKLIRTKQSGRP